MEELHEDAGVVLVRGIGELPVAVHDGGQEAAERVRGQQAVGSTAVASRKIAPTPPRARAAW